MVLEGPLSPPDPSAPAPLRHLVGALFPGEIRLGVVDCESSVRDALREMTERRYSQLLVTEANKFCGVFSLWDLARALLDAPDEALTELRIRDLMDTGVPTVKVTDSLDHVLVLMREHESLPVVSPHGPQAVVTRTDVLDYFHRIARRFLLVEDIERTLRELISACVPDDRLAECATVALAHKYEQEDRPPPLLLHEMTFQDCVSLIDNKQNYGAFFEKAVGLRSFLKARLGRAASLRNDVFHFRREITSGDLDNLRHIRDWLAEKLSRALSVANAEVASD